MTVVDFLNICPSRSLTAHYKVPTMFNSLIQEINNCLKFFLYRPNFPMQKSTCSFNLSFLSQTGTKQCYGLANCSLPPFSHPSEYKTFVPMQELTCAFNFTLPFLTGMKQCSGSAICSHPPFLRFAECNMFPYTVQLPKLTCAFNLSMPSLPGITQLSP